MLADSGEPPRKPSVWAQYAKRSEDNAEIAEPRGCLPTFVVAVLMFAIAFSGAIAFAAVEGDPLPVLHVDGPVSIQPIRGWEFVSGNTPMRL